MTVRTTFLLLASVLIACAPYSKRVIHDAPYRSGEVPAPPDYTDDANWAALPTRSDDASDVLPEGLDFFNAERDGHAGADIFFVHPTIYTDEPGERYPWNASVTDADLNASIDESTIRMQASVFNGAGDVYAPRYRQAHISAYYTPDTAKARAAFDTAYADVRRAFESFLRRRDPARPIIVAGHSQGTTHGKRLVREYFDGTPLADKLVAAYLIGIPVQEGDYANLEACTSATQTGCLISWRTWQRPATPWDNEQTAFAKTPPQPPYPIVVNPLTWQSDTTSAPAELNRGGTLRKLELIPELADAQAHRGILWTDRPDFFGKRIIRMENWHAADINLYYANVFENARQRVAAWYRHTGA